MHKQVYFHKTRLACNYHLEKAMRAILKEQQKFATENVYYPGPDSKEHLEQFLSWDDYKVMGLLASGQGGEHGERLMTRNHYRLVCELEESDENPHRVKCFDEEERRNCGYARTVGKTR